MVNNITSGIAGGATISIVIRAVDQYSKELKKFEDKTKKQATTFQKLGVLLTKTGIGYAAVAGAAASFAVSAVKAALESERATQQFNLSLGDLADTMREDLRVASKGLVSNFQLMDNANRALALGINKNQLVPLMEVAAARSKVFGRTVTEAFNDITIGIGRQSRLILDNLGIIIDLDKTYKRYAESLGKTSEALSESEKKQALVNAIIEDTQPLLVAQSFLVETNTEKLQRLSSGWENVKENVGLWITSQYDAISVSKQMEIQFQRNIDQAVGAEGTYDRTANAFKTIGEEIKGATDRSKELLNSLKDISNVVLAGESEKNIKIAEAQQQADAKRLEILKLQNRYEGKGASEKVLEVKQKELDILNERLDILKLEREVEFGNVKAIEQAKAEGFINEQSGIIQTTDEFLKNQEEKKQKYFEEQENIKILTSNQADLAEAIINSGLLTKEATEKLKIPSYQAEEDAIQKVINKTNDLIKKYNEAAKARSGADVKVSKTDAISQIAVNLFAKANPFINKVFGINDAIIRPNGDIIKTNPADYLIATKNPQDLAGGIVINIENVNGLDPDMVAEALQNKLKYVISI